MSRIPRILFAVGVGLVACHPAGSDHPSAHQDHESLGAGTISGERLSRDIQVLASDAYGGRFPGTSGEAKTVAYISTALARAGIEPGLEDGFLQPVPLIGVSARSRPAVTASSEKGPEPAQWEASDAVIFYPPRPRAALELSRREVVFAGYGIEAPEHRWDDYGEVDVQGKIVVVLGGEPAPKGPDDERFEGRSLSPHGTPKAKREAAARHGAAGMLIMLDGSLGVSWNVLSKNGSQTKYELAEDSEKEGLSLAGIVRPDLVERLVGDPDMLASWIEDAGSGSFRSREIEGATLTFAATYDLRPIESHNVIGILRGHERPDEYVIYTAHWDHVGVRDGAEGDRIFNGAVDNATGTAALLSLAHAFGSLPRPPARSVVFMATTAEEQGLLGAWHYVAQPVFPLNRTVGVINMDALFPFGVTKGMTVVASGSSELERYIETAALAVGRKAYPDPQPELGAFFRSDHYPFADAGVPAVFAVGGPAQDPSVGETVDLQRFVEYITEHYHQPTDEYDPETWDMGGIVQDVEVYFRAGYALAEDKAFPNWLPGHPFRPRRDAMRSAG